MITLLVASVYLCSVGTNDCRTIESQMSFESLETCSKATRIYLSDSYTEALRRLGLSIRSVTCGPGSDNGQEK